MTYYIRFLDINNFIFPFFFSIFLLKIINIKRESETKNFGIRDLTFYKLKLLY